MRTCNLDMPDAVSDEALLVYARCYQLETWFRELVYLELKAHFGPAWWHEAEQALQRSGKGYIPPDRSLDNDKKHPHMTTAETDPLWFISFDSLLTIIFDQQLWPVFACYLTTKDLLEAKFKEIAPIRNRVAHCRALHEDDLDRLRRLLRDLDHGFWHFCTSFNHTYPFIAEGRNDPIYQHFAGRMGFDYVETEPGKWALVGSTRGMSQNVSVEYSTRPSADPHDAIGKGRIYHLTFSTTANARNSLDFAEILKRTKRYHAGMIYIILDSLQTSLRASFPALFGTSSIVEAAEEFYYSCGNCFTYSFHDHIRRELAEQGTDLAKDLRFF